MDLSKFADLQNPGVIPFSATGEYFEGTPPDVTLFALLGLDEDRVKPFTRALLNWQDETTQNALQELARGIWAYQQFQDILDSELTEDLSPLENRHYCYYESLYYLREAATCLLDGNVLASKILLRPFLELSVSHLYWFFRCRHRSYGPYYQWLKAATRKSFSSNWLELVLKSLPGRSCLSKARLELLKSVVLNQHRHLSNYHHLVVPQEAFAGSAGYSGISYTLIFEALTTLNVMVNQLVILYVLAYPASMFPVRIYNKFGLSRPVGLMFDDTNFAIVKAYLGEATTDRLRNRLHDVNEVRSLVEWVGQQPDLTDEEVLRLSQERYPLAHPLRLGEVIAREKAHLRSLGWFMNYLNAHGEPEPDDREAEQAALSWVKSWP